MATTTLSLNKLIDYTEGNSFVVNDLANGSTKTFIAVFNISDHIKVNKWTPKISTVKVGGQNWLSTEIVKITYTEGTYNILTNKFAATDTLSNSDTVSEKDGTTSSSVTISDPNGWAVYSKVETLPAIRIKVESTQSLVGCKVEMSGFSLEVNYESGHRYTSKVTKAATCTSAGETTYTCECGDSYVDKTVPKALGHSFGSTTAAKAATCTTAGNSAYKKCSRCNLYFAGSAATNATGGKSDTSSFTIAKKSHSYTGAIKSDGNGKDATHSFKCVNGCNNYGGAVKHTWNDGAVTKEPTCTDKGEKTFTCTAGCGARYAEELDALGHIYNEVKTEAKPEAPGYTTHTCSRCGHSYKDNYVYYITFKNGDGSELEGVKVAEGNTPVCSKAPTKASTAEYDYTWDKSNPWTPAIGAATANQVYTPNFTATKRSYTVTFKDEGGATIKTESVQYGNNATPPTAPEKADTAQWDYSFEGWFDSNNNKWDSNTVITGNTTFTAQYSAKTQEYTVVWKNYDGTVLETDTGVLYGTKPKYDGPVPTRPGNAEHSYEFAGWDYDINADITGNKIFTAKFEEVDNGYVVRWLNADGTELETDEWVSYGNKPDYNGETPSMDDEEFTYTFIGWRVSVTDPAKPESELETVKGDITYTAVYDKTPKLYAITVILLNSESTAAYEYGRTVTIEAPDEEGYNFIGWSDGNTDKSRDVTVLGVATYRAVYEIKTYELKLSYRATEGEITGVSQGIYNHGTSITATAVPVKGYKFSYWTLTKEDGTEETFTDSTIQFNITSNITIGAVFAKIPPPDITFAQILYKNKQISATNKVPADEYFRIVVAAVAYD